MRLRAPFEHLDFLRIVPYPERMCFRFDAKVKEMGHAIGKGFPVGIGEAIGIDELLTPWCLDVVASPIERGQGVPRDVLGSDPIPAIGCSDRWSKSVFFVTHGT